MPRSKRQKVMSELGNTIPIAAAKVSRRLVEDLLREGRDDELAHNFQRKLDDALQKVQNETQVVLVMQTRSGGQADLPICEPAAILTFLLRESVALQRKYVEVLRRRPSTANNPWRILASFDEFTPGAQITGRHERKFMHLIFNFLELGAHFLTMEDGWASAVVTLQCAGLRAGYLHLPGFSKSFCWAGGFALWVLLRMSSYSVAATAGVPASTCVSAIYTHMAKHGNMKDLFQSGASAEFPNKNVHMYMFL